MTIFIVFCIYVLSVYGARLEVRYLFMNRWKSLNPDGFSFFVMLCPFMNSFLAIAYVFRKWFGKIDLNKIFDIERRP